MCHSGLSLQSKFRENRPLIFCVLLGLYNSRHGAKECFQFALTRWPRGQNCKSLIHVFPSSALTARSYFPAELAICARGIAHLEKRRVRRDECMCLSLQLFSCLQMGESMFRKVSCESALATSFMSFLSVPGHENVHLNMRLLTCAACSPCCQILGINEEKHEMITGYVRVSPRSAEMKGESATKDVMLAKCPLSIFDLNDFIILTYPAECLRIFHSGVKNFTLSAPVSATASQSGHCLTSEGQARRAESKRSISRLIRSDRYMAYLRV